jgi:hypothetical protein
MGYTFRGRLASIRINPSRSEDANDISRFVIEAHDLAIDPIRSLIDKAIYVEIEAAGLEPTPLEVAIDQADSNGEVNDGRAALAGIRNGRRRRGSRADATEGE